MKKKKKKKRNNKYKYRNRNKNRNGKRKRIPSLFTSNIDIIQNNRKKRMKLNDNQLINVLEKKIIKEANTILKNEEKILKFNKYLLKKARILHIYVKESEKVDNELLEDLK